MPIIVCKVPALITADWAATRTFNQTRDRGSPVVIEKLRRPLSNNVVTVLMLLSEVYGNLQVSGDSVLASMRHFGHNLSPSSTSAIGSKIFERCTTSLNVTWATLTLLVVRFCPSQLCYAVHGTT